MLGRKIASVIVLASLILNVSIYTYADADVASVVDDSNIEKEILYNDKLILSDGLSYIRNIYYHNQYGNEREYILEYSPYSSTKLNFDCNEYLYKTSRINDMANFNHPDENIVAGINADFFNMSTGVPESAFIKNYEIYTTDRDTFCLALTSDGRYFFDKPQINIKIYNENDTEISIAHLNKEFSEYALYLYNARYSTTTHIKDKYSSAVLVAFDDVKDVEELLLDMNLTDLYTAYNLLEDKTTYSDFHKAVEASTGYEYIAGKFYMLTDVLPQIGTEQNLVVKESFKDCSNTEIPINGYLLCGDNRSYGYIPAGMKAGDTLRIVISGNETYANVSDAIGVGDIIVNNGEIIDSTRLSHYANLEPRSAVGIKEDGTLVFYATDGRQKNKSAGLKLLDLARVMKSLGCVYAANLDGGGSTAVSAFRPGTSGVATVSNPSGSSERKISNCFVFTNEEERNGYPYSAHVYKDYIVTFNDWLVEIPEYVISDSNGFAYIPAEDDVLPQVDFYTTDGTSQIFDGVIYPSGMLGEIDVYSSVNGMLPEYPAFSVYTISAPDTINLKAEKTQIAPFETIKLEVSSKYRNIDVISGNQSYIWSVKSADEMYATGLNGNVSDGIFYPFKDGVEYNISASRGDALDSVTIYVDAYPFADIKEHWAVKEIYQLAKSGVVNGYPGENENEFLYLPQRNYSRYEFCVMLDRITDIGDDLLVPEKISDEAKAVLCVSDFDDIPDWAYESVYKLFVTGYLGEIIKSDGMGGGAFKGSDFIIRADVMNVIGKLCDSAPDDYNAGIYCDLPDYLYSDTEIKNCLYSGIFSGYEDMTVRPWNNLTRAEAAAVFVRLNNYISDKK